MKQLETPYVPRAVAVTPEIATRFLALEARLPTIRAS